MELLTDDIQKQAEGQYKLGSDMDQEIVAKFFTPWSNWTWYLMNKSPDTDYCWGIVRGIALEMGSFSIDELESIAGPLGMNIERDQHFTPIKAKTLWKELSEKENV